VRGNRFGYGELRTVILVLSYASSLGKKSPVKKAKVIRAGNLPVSLPVCSNPFFGRYKYV
jgi:hypothetical protein